MHEDLQALHRVDSLNKLLGAQPALYNLSGLLQRPVQSVDDDHAAFSCMLVEVSTAALVRPDSLVYQLERQL